MDVSEFTPLVAHHFEHRFKALACDISQGRIKLTRPYTFPTGLRIGQSPSHLIAELVGSAEITPGGDFALERPTRPETVSNTSAFFCPGFEVNETQVPLFRISKEWLRFGHFILATPHDAEVFAKKVHFPLSGVPISHPEAQVPLLIMPSSNHLILWDIHIIRTDGVRVLYRTVGTAIVVRRDASKDDVATGLGHAVPETLGMNLGRDRSSDVFAQQLLSLADQAVDEQIIDDFIRQHGHLFAKALNCRNALPQVRLKWIDPPPGTQIKESVPDYLMERDDGYYDILDLKKGLLRRGIVKGRPSRRRFGVDVSDLIAQLSGYRKYFGAKANQDWALEHYGVRTNKPRLIRIVGNYDTCSRGDVDDVLEQYRDDLVLLSYADVVDLLRRRTSPLPPITPAYEELLAFDKNSGSRTVPLTFEGYIDSPGDLDT